MSTAQWDEAAQSEARGGLAVRKPRRKKGPKTQRRPEKKNPWARGLDWPVVIWVVIVHVGALAAPVLLHLESGGHRRLSRPG